MTDPLGQSQVLPYLVGLSKKGFSFHLISFEKEERFEKNNKHIQDICDVSGIIWHPLSYTKKPPLFSTIYDVQRMKRLAYRLHKNNHFKIIHCRSYISAIVGLGMKRKFGTKFLFDMRGFWANERVDGKIWNLNNPIFNYVYTYFKKKEIAFFTEADYTISLTFNGKNEIESWPEFKEKKPLIEVIPCCVDLELFNPDLISESQQKLRKEELGISPQDYVLGYVGSIGTWYMLPEMLDYFKVIKETNTKAKFMFVTNEHPSTILSKATDKGIDEASIIITSCRHTEVPLNISLFNTSVFFILPSYSKKASSPTKQGEIMAMGIPLVCNAGVGDTDLVVEKYRAGIVINELNESSYRTSIIDDRSYDRETSMKGSQEFYSLEVGVERYLRVYEKLLTN